MYYAGDGHDRSDVLKHIKASLLKGRAHRYCRYLHARDAVRRLDGSIKTVLVAGAGHGMAEVAIAIEFPHIQFTCSDIIAKGYPNYHSAMDFCWKNGIDNVRFTIWDVLEKTDRKFDLVCSTEMIEHVPDAVLAAKNMREASKGYVYCLAPLCQDDRNLVPEKRAAVWQSLQHYVLGYSAEGMRSLFGEPMHLAGTYWQDRGIALRLKTKAMTDEEIVANYDALTALGDTDLIDAPPVRVPDAWGIKIIARRDAPLPERRQLPPSLVDLLGHVPKRELQKKPQVAKARPGPVDIGGRMDAL